MASYYYLISSLPMLKTSGEMQLDYPAFLAMCKSSVSVSTYRSLEELSVSSDKGPLLKEWAEFYGVLKQELTYQRKLKLGRPCPVPVVRDAAATQAVTAALAAANPLQAEQILLQLQFSRLDSLTGLHNFDDQALFGYAMKLKLLERQRTFRYEEGKAEFDSLLGSIRQQIFSI